MENKLKKEKDIILKSIYKNYNVSNLDDDETSEIMIRYN